MPRPPLRILCLVGALLLLLPPRAPAADKPASLNEALRPYHVQFAGVDAPVLENFRRASAETVFDTIIAGGGSLRVEIEVVAPESPELAANYSKSKYEIIKALYGPQYTPYPGEVTNQTECPPDRKPLSRTVSLLGKDTEVLLANATERYTFGVWEDDLIKQRGAFCVLYDDATKTLYQFKVFQPSSATDESLLATVRTLRRIP
jgi:hypothetical protein